MKRKAFVVLVLVLVEFGLCAGMYTIVQATFATLPQITVGVKPSAMAEVQEEKRFALDGPATLGVDNSYGFVRIVAGTVDEMQLSAHKRVWAANQAEAQAALAAVEIQTTQDGNAVILEPTSPPPTGLSVSVIRPSVDITITVPAATAVTSHILSGGITLSGTTGDAVLTTNRGAIRVNNVKGNLTLQTDSGDITAENVDGQIQTTSNRGTLRLSSVHAEGEVKAKTISGDAVLQDCTAGSIVVQADRGRVNLSRCTAEPVQVTTLSGDVDISQGRTDALQVKARRD